MHTHRDRFQLVTSVLARSFLELRRRRLSRTTSLRSTACDAGDAGARRARPECDPN